MTGEVRYKVIDIRQRSRVSGRKDNRDDICQVNPHLFVSVMISHQSIFPYGGVRCCCHCRRRRTQAMVTSQQTATTIRTMRETYGTPLRGLHPSAAVTVIITRTTSCWRRRRDDDVQTKDSKWHLAPCRLHDATRSGLHTRQARHTSLDGAYDAEPTRLLPTLTNAALTERLSLGARWAGRQPQPPSGPPPLSPLSSLQPPHSQSVVSVPPAWWRR